VDAKDTFDCWLGIEEYWELWHLLYNVSQFIIAQVRNNNVQPESLHLRLLKFRTKGIGWVQNPETSCGFQDCLRYQKSPASYQWLENHTCEISGQVTDFIRWFLLVMCHHCRIQYRSSLVPQGIGKWRCVSKINPNLTFSEVDGTESLNFSVWILGLLFEDHTDKFFE